MKFRAVVFLANLYFFLFTIDAEYSDNCLTYDGKPGRCIKLKECGYILEVVQAPEKYNLTHSKVVENMRKSSCGFIASDPLVCCPSSQNSQLSLTGNVSSRSIFSILPPIEAIKQWLPIKLDQISVSLSVKTSVGQAPTSLGQQTLPNLPQSVLQSPPLQKPVVPVPQKPPTSAGYGPSSTDLLPLQDCGLTLTNHYFRGNRTDLDDFPWTALLEFDTPLGHSVVGCGGTLISNRYVLTAAHCVTQLSFSYKLASVRLGEYDLDTAIDCLPENDSDNSTYCADPPISVPVEEVTVHPQFIQVGSSRLHDVALIRLAVTLTFTHFIKPICLPLKPPTLKRYHVAGWGKSFSRRGTSLKYMTYLTRQDNKACNEIYKATRHPRLFEDQICVGGEASERSCIVDTGGALMAVEERLDRSHRLAIHAVLSTIYLPTGTCHDRSWPGIFTVVYDQLPWILSAIRQ